MKRLLFVFFAAILSIAPAEASRAKGVTKVQLDNGSTVLIKENHAQPVVSVQVWVKAGSVNEADDTRGLSHFIEHLLFKGSDKYPGDTMSRLVETQGGIINAATSKEYTQYHIDIQSGAYKDTIRLLADASFHAAFPAEDIDRERPVVIEEIRRHKDNPGATLYDHFNQSLFPTTPYRHSIIGSDEVIRTVTRERILEHYHRYYVPGNMIVTITGDVKTAEALALVRDTFGVEKGSPVPTQPNLMEPLHAAVSFKVDRDVENAYWMGGLVGPDLQSGDQFAADITAVILGGAKSSRLYQKLRESRQLVYSIGSSFWSQRGSGILAISAVFPPEKEKEVLKGITDEIELLRREGPDPAELKRAKEIEKAQWFFGLETFHDQGAALGYWHLQGNPGMIDAYVQGIEKVTARDVQRFLDAYFEKQQLSEALLLPAAKSKQ